MARSITLNGTSFSIPQTGDSGWSQSGGVDDYLVALSTGVLTKAGGTFTLSAEVNLGATYGLKVAYLKTQTANPASAGVLRLAKTDTVSWRNNANGADLALAIDGSDNLTFNGTKVGLSGNIVNADISNSAAIAYSKLNLAGAIQNSDLAGSIAYSKLVLTGSIVNADVSASAAIAYSKLSLAGAIQNADLAGSIAYSKLVLTGSIVNADVSASAAIAYSKLNLAGAVKLASDVTGQLPTANGGTGQNSTATFPTSGVVVTEAGTETLTNKTLTAPVIATITNTGTLTLPTSTDTLVGRATTDTLTNKTLTSPTITTPTQTSYEDLTEIATPAAPGAGKLRVYAKSDDNLYVQTSAGQEKAVGSGSGGSGQKNYVSGATSTWAGGWTAYGTVSGSTDLTAADLPRASTTATGWKLTPSGSTSATFTCTSATPAVLTVTGHGMQTGYTITVSNSGGALPTGLAAATVYYVNVINANTFNVATTMANLLAGTYVATSSTGSGTNSITFGGAYLRFTLDAADYNVKQQLQHAQNILSGATGDWEVDVYSNTASNYSGTYTRLLLSTDSSGSTSLPNLEGTFRTTFDAPGSAAQYIEVRFNKLAANTHALVGSDLIVGPGTTAQGAAVSGWQAYTPTVGNVAVSSSSAQWRRIGDAVEIRGTYTSSAQPSGNVNFSLPTGLTINTAVAVPGASTNTLLGQGYLNPHSGNLNNLGVVYSSSTAVQFMVSGAANFLNATVPITGAANDIVTFQAIIPVNEWAGSGTVNIGSNDLLSAANSSSTATADDTTSFTYGPAGSGVTSLTGSPTGKFKKRVRFPSPIQATDSLVLKVKVDNVWVPVLGTLYNGAGTGITQPFIDHGGATYGIGLATVAGSTTDVDVMFGQYRIEGAGGFGTAGGAWGSIGSSDWGGFRVDKVAGGAAVGFGIVQPGTSSGLVSASGVPGNQTGNAIATGYVGEVLTFTSRTVAGVTSGYTANASALTTLSAGVWLLLGNVTHTAATSLTAANSVISTDNSNAFSNAISPVTVAPGTSTISMTYPMAIATYVATGNTPIYAKAATTGASANITITGYAVRIA